MGLFSDPNVLVTVHRKPFTCRVCGDGLFQHRRALLNTGMAEFFHLAWANRSADCTVCDTCGHIEWFLGSDPVVELWEPEGGYPAPNE